MLRSMCTSPDNSEHCVQIYFAGAACNSAHESCPACCSHKLCIGSAAIRVSGADLQSALKFLLVESGHVCQSHNLYSVQLPRTHSSQEGFVDRALEQDRKSVV